MSLDYYTEISEPELTFGSLVELKLDFTSAAPNSACAHIAWMCNTSKRENSQCRQSIGQQASLVSTHMLHVHSRYCEINLRTIVSSNKVKSIELPTAFKLTELQQALIRKLQRRSGAGGNGLLRLLESWLDCATWVACGLHLQLADAIAEFILRST